MQRTHNPLIVGSSPTESTYARVAQWREHRTSNARVEGSSPSASANFFTLGNVMKLKYSDDDGFFHLDGEYLPNSKLKVYQLKRSTCHNCKKAGRVMQERLYSKNRLVNIYSECEECFYKDGKPEDFFYNFS